MSNRALVIILLAIAIVINVTAQALSLWEQLAWLDKGMHAFSSFALTFALAIFLHRTILGAAWRHPVIAALTIASVGLALGVVWEIGEWIFDRLHAPNVIKGKTDTLLDLIADSLGAVLAAWLSLERLPKST